MKFKKLAAVAVSAMLIAGCSTGGGTGDGATFKAGTYEGSAAGFNGDLKVEVVLSDEAIDSVTVTENSETEGIGSKAVETLPQAIVDAQSVDVDSVSGATVSSEAIKAAVTMALEAAGVDVASLKPVVSGPVEKEDKTMDVDVVIVGAGGAGMSAAITAAEEGKKVLLIEKAPMVGGNTSRATGGMNAAETKYQKEAGIEDSVDLFVEDTMTGGHNLNNEELVRTLAENSASAIDWLDSIGAHLNDVGKAGGASVSRSHRPLDENGKILSVGSYLVPIMEKACADKGVEIMLETEATEIIMKDGQAVGVKAESKTANLTVNAKSVIITTGGFGGNLDMVVEYKPELKGYVTTNAPTITGDGIKMLEAAGADFVDMDQIQIHPTVVQSNGALITESLRGDGAILINNEGKRFTNEILTRDVVSANVIAQPGSTAWLIVDDAMYQDSTVIQGYVNKGYMTKADTIEDLAKVMNVDAAVLQETMDAWAADIAAQTDAEFGRDDLAEVKYHLDTAPYYAVMIAPGIHHTMGGVKIDTSAEVLDKDGNVIPGLFAAGEVTGGVHGGNRLGGNAVADIVVFGRIAGANAAAYAK